MIPVVNYLFLAVVLYSYIQSIRWSYKAHVELDKKFEIFSSKLTDKLGSSENHFELKIYNFRA